MGVARGVGAVVVGVKRGGAKARDEWRPLPHARARPSPRSPHAPLSRERTKGPGRTAERRSRRQHSVCPAVRASLRFHPGSCRYVPCTHERDTGPARETRALARLLLIVVSPLFIRRGHTVETLWLSVFIRLDVCTRVYTYT